MDKRMRAKGVDLRKHSENTTTPKKPLVPNAHSSSSSEKVTRTVSINDLPESEKQKIAKLAEKVLELNKQVAQLTRQIEQERVRHAEEIRSIHATIEGQISIIEDRLKLKDGTITKLEYKEQMITAMLALYQAKLKNMADICRLAGDNEEYNKKKLTQMQADLDHFHIITQNQKKLIESFDETKQQMEERVKSIESRHAKSVKTLEEMISEETDRRLRAEKLSLQQGSENIMLKAEVQQLQYQLQQMRALHTSSLDQETLIPHLRRAASSSATNQPAMEAPRPTSVAAPPVATGTTPSAMSSSSSGNLQPEAKEDANPFKKYGPYDEYSLLFNNSQGDESGVQSPVGKAMTSPLPTPAATKVPFASAADGSSPSRSIISQAEDLLRRSRNIQLLSSTAAEGSNAASMSAPPPAPPSMAYPVPVGGAATMNNNNMAPPPLPPLKSMDVEPVLTALSSQRSGQDPPMARSSAAVQTAPMAPPVAAAATVGAPAFFPRDSRDSLISSVGRPADHVEFDGDEETFDDEEDEVDEEDDDDDDDDGSDESDAEGVEAAATAPTPAAAAAVATLKQTTSEVRSGTADRRQHARNQTTTAVPSASQSLDLTQTSLSNGDLRDSRRITAATSEPATSKQASTPPQPPPAAPTATTATTAGLSASKPFYPMRPLAASGTNKGESPMDAAVVASGTPATVKTKKIKKKVPKESKKSTSGGGIALVTNSYEDSRPGSSPVGKSMTQVEEPVRVSKVKKVKRSKPSTTMTMKKDPSSGTGAAGTRDAGLSVSFVSHESKDAVALLQEKASSLLVSSTESITYLPRPPPRSAQKQKSSNNDDPYLPRDAPRGQVASSSSGSHPKGKGYGVSATASPPSGSSSSGHGKDHSQQKKKSQKASPNHLLPSESTEKPTKVGNNLHYAIPPRRNVPSLIDDHLHSSSSHHPPPPQQSINNKSAASTRSRSTVSSSINDKFDASLFDLVDELERHGGGSGSGSGSGGHSRQERSYHHDRSTYDQDDYDDDDDDDDEDDGV